MPELILYDIFSYSCMNCLRSLDFIKKIGNRYKKYGLKTIIIHPPEWEFEKQSGNILNAVKNHNIKLPVIIDKNYKIIKKLKVGFWPAQILVRDGKIVYRHIGEGNYKVLEKTIARFLKIKPKDVFRSEPKYSKFPAIYCGKKKNGKIINSDDKLKFGAVCLGNGWVQKKEFIQSVENDARLTIKTKGRITNFVAESLTHDPIKILIEVNDKSAKSLSIKDPQLYSLIKFNKNIENILNITTGKNLAIYSFSFR